MLKVQTYFTMRQSTTQIFSTHYLVGALIYNKLKYIDISNIF